MDNFQQYEQIGRKMFKKWCNDNAINVVFTKEQFDRLDAYIICKGVKIGVEIKNRALKYKDYPTLMMEVSKLYAMKKNIQQHNLKDCWYVNFIGNEMFIFRYSRIKELCRQHKVELTYMHCNKTTAVESNKVDKRALLIDKKYSYKTTL